MRTVGPWRLDPADGRLLDEESGTEKRLTTTELAILLCLLRADGAVVPNAIILRDALGYSDRAVSRTVETHVYRLRRKLEVEPSAPRLLQRGEGGYRLVVEAPARPAPCSSDGSLPRSRSGWA